MRALSLDELEPRLRVAWSDRSCDPVDLDGWSAANPARGQCAVTALIVQEHLGGELLMGEVTHLDGSRQGVHFWNRLPGGTEVDLTREQFREGETVHAPSVVPRPPDLTVGRLASQYRVLAERLATSEPGP
jgi:hypothetical protein